MKSFKSLLGVTLASFTLGLLGTSCSSEQPLMPNLGAGPNLMGSLQPGGMPELSAMAAASRLIQTHFVKAYKGAIAENQPLTQQDPNGPAQALIRWINGSRKSLDGAFYDLGSMDVVQALIQAHKRGVKVRLITDNENMTEKDTGPTGPIRQTIVALKQAGIPLIDDQRSGLMHNKFLIIDSKVIWTGSTNLTNSSLFNHNNNALSIQSPEMVANFQGEFNRMFVEHAFGPNPPRQVPFPVARVGKATIETYFSPKGGGQEAVIKTIQSAKKNIAFMTFSLTDKTIGGLMVQKKQAGVNVNGVFDRCLGSSKYSLYSVFRQNNVYSRIDGNEALLHHKVILVDNTVITGSNNYSNNSESSNNENILIIHNDAPTTQAYYDEYNRVMNAAKNNRPPLGECPGQKPVPPTAPVGSEPEPDDD